MVTKTKALVTPEVPPKLLYRGAETPVLGLGDFPGVFLSTSEKQAAQWGDVSQYKLSKPQNILDIDDAKYPTLVDEFAPSHSQVMDEANYNETDELMLFPPKEWVGFLKDKGYTGTKIGSDHFIFDKGDIELVKPMPKPVTPEVTAVGDSQSEYVRAEYNRIRREAEATGNLAKFETSKVKLEKKLIVEYQKKLAVQEAKVSTPITLEVTPKPKVERKERQTRKKQTKRGLAQDKRLSNKDTIRKGSPRFKRWKENPGSMDVEGIDTPPITGRRPRLSGSKSPRITPKRPKLRR